MPRKIRQVTSASPPRSTAVVRPEIQALRALAVGIVVVYHLWPSRLPGGFVGVDVFFAISGFLITAHLLREAVSTGRVSLPQFWARRARRLLPASLLVLVASAIATLVWVPAAQWVQFFREIAASALYVQNWELATNAVDYLAADNDPSPVQHYWSLSAEEQFYIVWPILILIALWFASKRSATAKRIAIGVVLGVVVVASLALSIWMTETNPAQAYFVTPTRAWEFGLGGLLAIVAGGISRAPHALRAAISWLGLAAIVVAALLYSGETPFPGYQALLPVLGTLAVIWAGSPDRRWSPAYLASVRPIQWLGDVSYSVYLWHWPLIVIVPFMLDRDLSGPLRVAILAVTLVLAWASKRYVEDPFRTGRFLSARKPRWTFVATAAAMVVVVGFGGAVVVTQQQQAAAIEAETEQVLEEAPECFGAPAGIQDNADACADFSLGGRVIPSKAVFSSERPEIYSEECRTLETESEVKDCVFGAEDSETTVALVGDSHAAQWFPALEKLADDQGFTLHVFFKSGCPYMDPDISKIRGKNNTSCEAWNVSVQQALDALPDLDTVVTASSSGYILNDNEDADTRRAAYESRLQNLVADGRGVLVLAETPRMDTTVIECVERSSDAEVRECGESRDDALSRPDYLGEIAATTAGVTYANYNDVLCTTDRCPAVIGNVITYRDDSSHMTAAFSLTMAALVAPALDEALATATR